jgi:hypothetical protein
MRPHLPPPAAAWLAVLVLVAAPAPSAGDAFLENALPLKPLVTTPSELLGGEGIQLTGREALTVGGGSAPSRSRAVRPQSSPLSPPRQHQRCLRGRTRRAWFGHQQPARAGQPRSPGCLPRHLPAGQLRERAPASSRNGSPQGPTAALLCCAPMVQVVFTRPVIALGSDFGEASVPASLVSGRAQDPPAAAAVVGARAFRHSWVPSPFPPSPWQAQRHHRPLTRRARLAPRRCPSA